MTQNNDLRMMVYASLMAALTAAGAYIAIPIGPVPIVMQNFFVMLTGLLLGWRWSLAAVAVYLLAGAVGLPVFAGGAGGIGRFAGPTGGYLMAYLPAVFIIGCLSAKGRGRLAVDLLALAMGAITIYALGVPWLKLVTGIPWDKAAMLGMAPFLPGDALKIAAAAAVAKALRPVIPTATVAGRPAAARPAAR